jgi:hypothetical protein
MDISAMYPASKIEKTARIRRRGFGLVMAGLKSRFLKILAVSSPFRKRGFSLVLVFWVLPGMSLQANDDYLNMLEAEAGNTDAGSGVSTAPASRRQPTKTHYAKKSDVIRSGLDFKDFEEELGSNYSGSHFLYVKLSNSKRQRVYRSYKEDNRISVIREEIVRLLSSG